MKNLFLTIGFLILLILPSQKAEAQLVYPGTVDTLTGEEMVFDFSAQGIPNDYPDAPARAFRDANGYIQMIASHYDCYRLKGLSFETLTRDYANGPVYTSALNSTYSNFNQNTWIHSPYTTDGVTIHSLNHTEFNGPTSGNWHNAVTYTVSTYTGKTYTQSASPNHLVWCLPYTYLAGTGPCGYFSPSNIVYNAADGYYYSMLHMEDRGIQLTGVGLIRTNDLADPASWRGWDGNGFNATAGNPYAPGFSGPAGHTLAPLNDLNDNIGTMSSSLTFNTYFNKWMLMGASSQTINGTTVYGFYYSLSDDLIHWSFRKLIKQMPIAWATATYPKVLYPSLIDPTDTSRNFTFSGQEAYIYYTKQISNTNRDLVRIKVRFNSNIVTPSFTINTTTENTTTANDANYGDGSALSRIAGNTSVTLRSIIQESNARPWYYRDSIYTVNFNIPGAGAQTIQLSAALPEIKYPLLINGYSQPGAAANSNNFGETDNAAMLININCNNKSGFLVNGQNTTLQGMAIYNASDAAVNIYDGGNNYVKGCYIGITSSGIRNTTYPEANIEGIIIGGSGTDASPDNIIGGTNNADRNIITGGVHIYGNGSLRNKIYGSYIGTDITGDTAIDRNTAGIMIYDSASYNQVGGSQPSMGNLISGNDDYGVVIYGSGTGYNTVEKNYIGVKSDLQSSLDNGLYQIRMYSGTHHNQIGTANSGNVIGTATQAIIVVDDSPNNSIQGNYIGTDATQTADLGINDVAVVIDGSPSNNNRVGGTGTGEGNVIANSLFGISTFNGGYGNSFLSNTFPNIEEMAIDLKSDGVTNNDNLDPDPSSGAPNNYLQNFPEMLDADSVAGGVRICAELNSNINENFIVQIYKSVSNTTSTFGAGEELIGSMNVTTASNGIAQISTTISHNNVHSGEFISMLVTDSSGNTSELGENWVIGNGSNANPTFIWLSATTVPENSPAGTVVGLLTPQDPDLCDAHTFSLVSGAQSQGNPSFTIVGNELRTNGVFNYEFQNVYNVRIRCTDQSGGYYDKPYPVNVTNVNEAPISLNLNGMTVAENLPSGTGVGLFSTVDPDAGSPTFTYTLVTGVNDQHNGLFTIVNNQLKTSAVLNSNTTPQCFIRVRTTDPGGLYYENPFTVTVTGANDPPTGITSTVSTIAENLPANSTVAVLDAVDLDVLDTHTFTLVSGAGSTHNAQFNIQGSNLRANSPFDYETAVPLSVRIRAVDPQGAAYEEALSFTVSNVNESPLNVTLSAAAADENQVAGTLIGALSSTDVDAGDSHTYTLVSGAGSTHNSSFAISNGQVQTAVALDYEITPVMNIRVRTTDAGGLTYEKSLTITVNDNNDAPTDLSLSSATFAENLSAGTTIAALSGVDQDAVDSHTYTLVSGAGDTDNASFTVAGTQLQTLNSFDFESQGPLSIRLRITDSQGADYEEAVVLNVTNVNEVPLTLMLSADSIAENEAAGTLVSNLSATDTDNNDSHTYQLVTGTGDADNSSFSVSGNTLLSAASFDFEIKNSYSIRLRATDAGGLFTDSAMIIRITDINESTTAIGEVNKQEGIIISPNPATHILEINAPGVIFETIIFNGLGQEIVSASGGNKNQIRLSCSEFERGLYICKTRLMDGTQYLNKVVLK
ncbi:MAG: hypothetical protein IPJ86_07795 [Bacteroidetes bacterium]|nr:hypothetical protein [Bacteroidota bacterium]